jgi:hypothetical protein
MTHILEHNYVYAGSKNWGRLEHSNHKLVVTMGLSYEGFVVENLEFLAMGWMHTTL